MPYWTSELTGEKSEPAVPVAGSACVFCPGLAWETSNESALRIRWPKCWSFSFSISPSSGGYAPGAQQRAAQARLSFTLRGFFTTWELASRCSPGHREGRSFGKGPGAAVFAATQPSHEEALPVATAPPDPSPLDSGAAVRGVEKARHA